MRSPSFFRPEFVTHFYSPLHVPLLPFLVVPLLPFLVVPDGGYDDDDEISLKSLSFSVMNLTRTEYSASL